VHLALRTRGNWALPSVQNALQVAGHGGSPRAGQAPQTIRRESKRAFVSEQAREGCGREVKGAGGLGVRG